MTSSQPPIAVFAHKRPNHLRACLEAIDRSEAFLGKKLPLIIHCDCARNEEDVSSVEETIGIAKKWKGAEVVLREHNYGFRNITEGITSVCNAYGRAIILEDDVLIAPDFLPFMCRALKEYGDDPRVFMVSGFMYFNRLPQTAETYFLNIPFIWGWATWKRAWDHFEWECTGWERWLKNRKNRYFSDCLGAFPFSKGFRKTMIGEWKAWAPRWMYAMAKREGLSLYPSRSLVWNCGCGGGTHGDQALDQDPLLGEREDYIHGDMEFEEFKTSRFEHEVVFPKEVKLNRSALRSLALVFLKERLKKEKHKRWRLRFKVFKFHLLRFFLDTFSSLAP
ncbi:MAG: hypothetical protein S4CHLAM45_07170 [Chlamydiales bacterium]|nr:hypothetical protein [Chlamydiales bacterium]MCH9620266.1 hypothetical protein [Chlamydiales bacterium]MCH9622824.1 hypothetical protein [Chlamydiales bacterium]